MGKGVGKWSKRSRCKGVWRPVRKQHLHSPSLNTMPVVTRVALNLWISIGLNLCTAFFCEIQRGRVYGYIAHQ